MDVREDRRPVMNDRAAEQRRVNPTFTPRSGPVHGAPFGSPAIDRRAGYERLVNAFAQRFGDPQPRVFRAPGRVNLIGEHTDYNDGFVLPMGIECAVWIAARPRPDRHVYLHALDFVQDDAFSLDVIQRSDRAPWSNYVRGWPGCWRRQDTG